MLRIHRKLFRSLVGLLAAWFSSGTAVHADTFSFSVVPQFPVVEVFRSWRPLLEALEVETGHKFELKTSESIPKFEASFLAAEPDFVYLNPYHTVMAHRSGGYIPLVRSSEPLSGILVVRKDSSLRELAELKGSTIAYPAPNAFGASLYMRALLGERFKLATEPVYVQTHVNAYRAVIRGDNPAAGGIRSTLDREPAEVRDKLRVLYETPSTASHPVAVHPRVNASVRTTVRNALLKIAKTEAGSKLMEGVSLDALVAADYAKDYAPLEALRLDRFVVQPK
ncbi:phosphate/phosphite/phosphonate ABC transporter substrate-binding protein [Rhodoferax mekongensis]|uniref:Phosphate/phosphite/phosphonate ABC transporter substrate-binding protein n=1 Tax=Rhodoferax mekongensis TaxID=3068341 RepID=A0ABZ0B1K1_9BURK|nr:phosphate/phosphite/phosphonate ABC transporter substrate-binding protein [Rhodoferax sp. TBRC 17307]WNO05328.1 phosphate/phosphite/phosphonate ABC transporter substrate-binding protein [Rhodoferax sp. TBRC 17307]